MPVLPQPQGELVDVLCSFQQELEIESAGTCEPLFDRRSAMTCPPGAGQLHPQSFGQGHWS